MFLAGFLLGLIAEWLYEENCNKFIGITTGTNSFCDTYTGYLDKNK